jgi:hypothetical protein
MIKEAIEHIGKLALQAQPHFFKPSGEPDHVYYLRAPDGSAYFRQEVQPKARAYSAATVDDFVALVKEMQEVVTLQTDTPGPTLIMVGVGGVQALLDERHRLERIRFPLTQTASFKKLLEADEERAPKNQQEFVSLLRVDLNECVDKTIVETFRNLKFAKNSEGESQISNSNKAISTKVQMSLAAGNKPIPDEIDARVVVYEEFPNLVMAVRCAVETCIEDATFTLIPLAGELSKASTETRHLIEQRIRELMKAEDAAGTVLIHCGEVNC